MLNTIIQLHLDIQCKDCSLEEDRQILLRNERNRIRKRNNNNIINIKCLIIKNCSVCRFYILFLFNFYLIFLYKYHKNIIFL